MWRKGPKHKLAGGCDFGRQKPITACNSVTKLIIELAWPQPSILIICNALEHRAPIPLTSSLAGLASLDSPHSCHNGLCNVGSTCRNVESNALYIISLCSNVESPFLDAMSPLFNVVSPFDCRPPKYAIIVPSLSLWHVAMPPWNVRFIIPLQIAQRCKSQLRHPFCHSCDLSLCNYWFL